MKSTHPSLAKLTPPRLPKIIDRTRLYRRLDQARKQRPILWITGPPGMGKTTLVASYLRARKLKPLWYQLDAGDGDLATFFHYLGLAAQQAAPRYKQPLPHLTPEYVQGLPIFTRRYFETLYSRLKPPSVLVFDNYQEVPGDSGLHQMLTIGVETLLPGQTVVVVSRENPPTAYARLQATQLMDHLTHEELRLTSTETMGIVGLRQWAQNTKPSPAAIEELQTKLDGWVAGLVLVLEQTNTGKQLEALLQGQTPQVVFEYLATEVFDQLEPAVQEFLMKTAVLPWTTSAMAQQLTDNDQAEEILARLFRQRYFTERREDAESIYQFHPLFHEFLLLKAKHILGENLLNQVRQKAGTLLVAANHWEEAVLIHQAAQGWQEIANLIVQEGPALMSQGRWQPLMNWCEGLPEEVSKENPWVLYWKGMSSLPINPPKSFPILVQSYECFRANQDRVGMMLTCCGILKSIVFTWEDCSQLDPWLDVLIELIANEYPFPSKSLEAEVTGNLFDMLLWRPRPQGEVSYWAERTLRTLLNLEDSTQRVHFACYVFSYYHWRGADRNAEKALDILRKEAKSQTDMPIVEMLLCFAEGHNYLNQTGGGAKNIERAKGGLRIAKELGLYFWVIQLAWVGLLGAMRDGNLELAEEYLLQVENEGHHHLGLFEKMAHFMASWVAWRKGDITKAKTRAIQSEIGTNQAGPFLFVMYRLVGAQILYDSGDKEQAWEWATSAHELMCVVGSTLLEADSLFIMAKFAFDEQQETKGIQMLKEGLLLCRNHEHWRLPFSHPRTLGMLCAKALHNQIEATWVGEFIKRNQLIPSKVYLEIFQWPWPVKIWTLDTFTIQVQDTPLAFTHKVPRKPLELLKAIMAFGGHDVSEERLIDALWPEAEGDKGKDVLLKTITRLRKIFGVEGILQHRDGKVSLDAQQCWVDAWAFEALMGQNQPDTSGGDQLAHPEKLEQALALYRQPFLVHNEASWSHAQRERLRTKYTQGVVALSQHWVAQQEWTKAESCLEHGLDVEPTTEALYQELIAGLMHQGRQTEAAQVYERCRKEFTTMLGIDPSAKTQRLLSPKSKE